MRLIIEFDDFHYDKSVDCLDSAEYLIKKYPNIVINFFTIPKYMGQPLYDSKLWCSEVADHIKNKNICLGVHGLTHSQEEFAYKSYNTAYNALNEAHQIFDKAGLSFVKAFRGPHWGICGGSIDALIYCKYKFLYSHPKHNLITDRYTDQIKIVHYNWNLKDEFGIFENPFSGNTCVAHGHTSNVCGNGIKESMSRITHGIDAIMSDCEIEFLRIDGHHNE